MRNISEPILIPKPYGPKPTAQPESHSSSYVELPADELMFRMSEDEPQLKTIKKSPFNLFFVRNPIENSPQATLDEKKSNNAGPGR